MNPPPVQNQTPACLRCQTPMERGFSIDNTYGAATQTNWNEGSPEPYKVLGMNTGSVKRGPGAARIPITTFRCPACGYLESYAFSNQTKQQH